MKIEDYINIFIFILLIANIVFSFSRRKQLINPSESANEEIHPELVHEVKLQKKDGYRVTSVHDKTIRMIKTRRYWFPWLLLLLVPSGLITMINTSFLCNIYGVELTLTEGSIRVATF